MQVPLFEGGRDHGSIEVAHGPGSDLLHRSIAAAEAGCVVLRGEVAHEGGDAAGLAKSGEGTLQESGLARTGTRYQAYRADCGITEAAAQFGGKQVVVL